MNGISTHTDGPTVLFIRSTQPIPGFLPGFGQPVLIAELGIDPIRVHTETAATLDALLIPVLPGYETLTPNDPNVQPIRMIISRLLSATTAILRSAGLPIFYEGTFTEQHAAQSLLFWRVVLPGLRPADTALALSWVCQLVNLILVGAASAALIAELPALIAKLTRHAPAGQNSLRFLQAAHDLGIPWRHVAMNVYQFGWGAQSRWLDSSFTDATSNIATRMARGKRATAALLRSAGIPVPHHALAADSAQAEQLAERLGYPVVVKPADQDGGKGVMPDLKDAASVRKAFTRAQKFSNAVLVEKHVAGNDYRLQVSNGEVYWAVRRIPGGVTGDGVQTVAELLANLNAEPLRGDPGSNALLKRIPLDEEAQDLLDKQGCALDRVPEAGRFVRLRRAANVASGGVIVPVLDQAHPDNLALAVRAARVLRLDLAGVDLLIPDISRSWLESGAAICEINAQPQLSPQLPLYLLSKLVQRQGRIPTVIVLGYPVSESWFDGVQKMLSADGCCLGMATPDGVCIGNASFVSGPCDAYHGSTALINDPAIDAVLICVTDTQLLRTGLPVDRFDALILSHSPVPATDVSGDAAAWPALAKMLVALCAGPVIIDERCAGWEQFALRKNDTEVYRVPTARIPDQLHRYLKKTLS